MSALSRRALLSRLARLSAASAFAPLLDVAAAPAERGFTPPRNLLVLFHPNGFEQGWKPAMAGGALSLGSTLAPLEAFKARLLVTHGLQAGIRHEVQAHTEGMTSMLTGSLIQRSDAYASHPSFDQLVAEKLAGATPLPSLELGVQTQVGFGAGSNAAVMTYSRAGKLPPQDDPNAAFARLFGKAATPSELAQARARRQSVLDLVRADLAKVRALAGAEAATKFDAHAAGLRALETRLDAISRMRCDGAFQRHALNDWQLGASERFPLLADLQAEVAVLALTCGVTRVVSLQFANSLSDRRIPGVNPNVGLHTVMHSGTRAEKLAINRYFAGLGASVLSKLAAAQRDDGTSLLDETLVVWGTEMAIGNHLNDPVPFIVAGGARPGEGYFHQGRLLEVEHQRTTRLLISAMHAFGLTGTTALGDLKDDWSRGPLPGASRVAP